MLLQLFAKNCPKRRSSFPCHKDSFETTQSFFCHNEGSFLKSPRPSLPLKRAPPLISVFSPQGRRGNRSSSSLVTISFYGWRTIRGLASSRAAICGMRPHGHESLRGCRLNSFNFWTYETWVNYLCSFAKFINAIAVNLLKQIRMSSCIKQAKD